MTAIHGAHATDAAQWFDQPKTIIHSGFPRVWLEQGPGPMEGGEFRIMLTGSLYDGRDFQILMEVLGEWLHRLAPADARRITLAYAGGDRDRAEAALDKLGAKCAIEINGFLPLAAVHRLQTGAGLNIYVHSLASPYRQKFMELLTTERPILCFPGESEDSLAIAAAAGGEVHSCDLPADISVALDDIWCRRHEPPVALDRKTLGQYSWESQADHLLDVFNGLGNIKNGTG